MKQKTLFVAALIALIAVFVGGAMFYSSQQAQQEAQRIAANQVALMRMHSPTLGKADAPVVIVEFLDPACETCRMFYPMVKQLMAAHPDKIRLVLRYAPFHNGSDNIVAALEAARKQGRFWPTLEALLASQEYWAPHHTPQLQLAWKYLAAANLDMERMAFDLKSPDIPKVIEQDLADARTLNVSKTPEFFVNGQRLPKFGFDQLQMLVEQELAKTSGR
ncbi:MAG: thioredoxin domain-containing protein [Rhodocyclales bacterium]|nr:thioredoxin domain-containing protein [Rhodocyclales bacterium]